MALPSRRAAAAGQLLAVASILVLPAGSTGVAQAQQVIDHQKPLLTLFVHGITLTHHEFIGPFCDICSYDTHRRVVRQITLLGDGSLRSGGAYNELEDGSPAFASTVSGKGAPGTFELLNQAIAGANLEFQPGGCSDVIQLDRPESEDYVQRLTLFHDYDLVWLTAGNDKVVEIKLDSAAFFECPFDLRTVIGLILQYEQEALAYTPHVSASR